MRKLAFRAIVSSSVLAIVMTGCASRLVGAVADVGTVGVVGHPGTHFPPPDHRPGNMRRIVPEILTPVLAGTTTVPFPVRGTDGKTFLAYELSMINGASLPVAVQSVEVLDATTNAVLQSYSGAQLLAHFRATGNDPTAPQTAAILGAGQHGFIWLDPSVTTGNPVPRKLKHRIKVSYPEPPNPLLPAHITEVVAETPVQVTPAPTIKSPVDGINWFNGNGCCDEVTPHRGSANPVNGQYFFAERFAIDWVQLDSQLKLYTGDPTKLSSYKYYGAPIHAVADGTIVATDDRVKDETPGANPPVGSLTLPQYAGNHVVEMFRQNGKTYYALYAHLKPGTVTKYSKVGQKVRAGGVIGLLGNSGNTDAPHLHFHLMDSPNPLASDGLPFQIDSLQMLGAAPGDAALNTLSNGGALPLVAHGPTGSRSGALPLYLELTTLTAG